MLRARYDCLLHGYWFHVIIGNNCDASVPGTSTPSHLKIDGVMAAVFGFAFNTTVQRQASERALVPTPVDTNMLRQPEKIWRFTVATLVLTDR